MFKFFRKKKVEEAKSLREAITQESSRHLKVHKWLGGTKVAIMLFFLVSSIVITFYDTANKEIGPHIAVISITGVIETGSRQTDGWRLSQTIKDAMEDTNVKGILLEANSPGGSPSDAELIWKTLMAYRNNEKYNKPVYATIRSSCASACYYIISAADEIYAMDSSLVGSIGVRMDGWDFREVLNKVGVKRRVYHAGAHKTLNDPFKAVSSEEKQFIQNEILDKLHKQFISAVKRGRGDRLNADYPELFSGLVWTGTEAKEIGLVDGIMTPMELEQHLEEKLGVDKYIYHGKHKFKLTNLFTMDARNLVDMVTESIYRTFKADVKSDSITVSFN